MKNPDVVTENILKSAKAEFLQSGYEKASMRIIAKNAEVTTGALYARYPNKDMLFAAIVKPVADNFFKVNEQGNNRGFEMLKNNNEAMILSGNHSTGRGMVELIYQNREDFLLLINCSHGSSYEGFIEKVIEIEEVLTMRFLKEMIKKGCRCVELTPQELHTVLSAQIYALFEVVRHDTPKNEAEKQVATLIEFFNEGWKKIFGIC